MILDTNALSALAQNDPAAEKVLQEQSEFFVSVVSAGEYLFGIRASRYRRILEAWLKGFLGRATFLDLDATVLSGYATIREELKKRGTLIPMNDIWIAAQARLHGLKILSRDRHFDEVVGCERVEW